jgi:spore germination protein GerM
VVYKIKSSGTVVHSGVYEALMKVVLLTAAFIGLTACAGHDSGTRVRLYFVNGHVTPLGWRGRLEALDLTLDHSPRRAVVELLRGRPAQQPRLLSGFPAGTRLTGFSVSRGAATVQVASVVPSARWGQDRSTGEGFYATAQLVYTLTEFHSINRVTLVVNGQRCCVYDQRSRPIAPLSRRTFLGWQGVPKEPAA